MFVIEYRNNVTKQIDMITVDEYIQTRNHGKLDFTS